MLIGLDIGGTKIEGVIVSSDELEVVHRIRIPTPKTNYADFVNSVKCVIDNLLERETIKSIGIGCCGSINRTTGKMQGANILYLNDQDFLGDLKAHYPLPLALTNDANCLAISEFKSGAAKDAESSCLAVIIGTGCGGGVIANGDIVDGLHGLGGEIGHNPLPHYSPEIDGPAVNCYCGSNNCIESFVSGTGFERTWATNYPKQSAQLIFEAYNNNNQNAIDHIHNYADRLARVLGTIINTIDPEIIVLGGGVSNQTIIYPLIQERINKYTFSKNVATPVVRALHGLVSSLKCDIFYRCA
ncbi:ROK family protein [Vibrio sp. SA48]